MRTKIENAPTASNGYYEMDVTVTGEGAENYFNNMSSFLVEYILKYSGATLSIANCPTENEGEYYDSMTVLADAFYTKAEFMKLMRKGIKEYKKSI